MTVEKTRIKFQKSMETNEIIGLVSRNSKTQQLRGVLESSCYKKKVCVLSETLKGAVEPNILYDVELKPMLSGNGYVVIAAKRTLFEATLKTIHIPKEVYRITISFGNKTIYFDPKDGDSISSRAIEGVCKVIDNRNDLLRKDDVKNQFINCAQNLILQMNIDGLYG